MSVTPFLFFKTLFFQPAYIYPMKNGTIDDVIQSVQECLIKGSDSPCGFSLAIGCQVPIGTSRENIEAYIYAARRYGRGAQKGKLCKGLYEEGLVS